MTRKDFELIAGTLRAELDMRAELLPTDAASDAYNGKTEGIKHAAVLLANVLGSTNDRFDRDRFLRAAGVRS